MPRISTQVSKSHPGVKRILSVAAGTGWRGRTVFVVQVDPSWTYSLYNDAGEPYVYQIDDISGRISIHPVPKPSYGGPATQVDAPAHGGAVVTRGIGPYGTVTIYVPMLDPTTLEIARDTLLEHDKKRSAQVLKDLGPYAGIGGAIAEAQATALGKSTSGNTSRKIAREVDEILRSTKGR
jgi:hypothetical protein